MEVFGALSFDRRIDRDLRPLFTSNADVGGVVIGYPLVNQEWTGDNIGDLYLGLKASLLSEERGRPFSLAMREYFKIPTALDVGASRCCRCGRMETRSYGEERPKYDNSREETRRLNRRAALVVKVQ